MTEAESILRDLGPLYHSYELFGVRNEQLPGIFAQNQRCKEPILRAYLQWAIAKCHTTSDAPVSFAELFCADGYYAVAAARMGASEAVGIDDNRHGQSTPAPAIFDRLGEGRARYIDMDVHDIGKLSQVDIVANIGGLYHVEDPLQVLTLSYNMARRFLIVQNVVSLATQADDYFESPAPGHTWGSRFSRVSFEKALRETGYRIIDQHFNELEGNDRPEDRGSVYALIEIT